MNIPRPSRSPEIERYFGDEAIVPELAAIGRSRQTRARPGLAAHCHDLTEVCLIERGQVDWFIDDRRVSLGADSVFFTRPGEIHGSVTGAFQPCVLSWLQVDQRKLRDRKLASELLAIDRVTWTVDSRLAALHGAMLAECRHPRDDSARMTRILLMQFLATVVRQAKQAVSNHELPEPLRRVIALFEDHPGDRWSLDALQEHAGVGRSRLHALFREYFGQSPAAYMLRQRMRHAHIALRQGKQSVTQVALRFGFSSSQHFATTFRNHFGVSPTDCRRLPGL